MKVTLQVTVGITMDEGAPKASPQEQKDAVLQAIRGAIQHCEGEGFAHQLEEVSSMSLHDVSLAPVRHRRRPDGKCWFRCPQCGHKQGHTGDELQQIGDPFCQACSHEEMQPCRRPSKQWLKQAAKSKLPLTNTRDPDSPWGCCCNEPWRPPGTVCRYCWDHLGRRKPSDPMPKRCVATFYPQVGVGNEFRDSGEPIPFDVTDRIAAMDIKAAVQIKDNHDSSDNLVPKGLSDAHRRLHGENAAFYVHVEDAIQTFFEKA